MFVVIFSMSFLILTTGYRGALISGLSIPYVPPAMDTLKQLAASHLPGRD